jgi:hypothetical protein
MRVLPLVALLSASPVFSPVRTAAQNELTRKVKTRVEPAYPAIARRMNISGTVKVVEVVGPHGAVKTAKVVGGHPLLVNAANGCGEEAEVRSGLAGGQRDRGIQIPVPELRVAGWGKRRVQAGQEEQSSGGQQ